MFNKIIKEKKLLTVNPITPYITAFWRLKTDTTLLDYPTIFSVHHYKKHTK